MKRKIGKRARLLAFLLAAIVMLTSFSFSSVYAEENQASDTVQKEINTDSPGEEDTTEEDKEPEKDLEKDLEIERQMKQLLKEIGVGFAEPDAQANNTSSMPRRSKATRAAGDVINTGRIKSNSIGRIDVIDYNDPSWPQLLTWREGLLGNTDTKEPLFCADPMAHFKAGKKTGVDASTIYNKETIQTVVAMMYYYDHYMCKSINSDYEYLMKQCAVWWVLNAVHGWFADGVQIETGNSVDCACGTSLSAHKSDYYKEGLVWAWGNYKYFTDAKGVIYQGEGQPLSSWSGTYNPKTYTSLAVKKIWDDQENKFGVRPSSITVNLYWWSNVDSTKHLYKTATLSPSNGWYVKWDNLERTDGSVTYDYTAEEEAVANYSGEMEWDGSYENGWTGYLTNKLKIGQLKIQKTSASPEITNDNDCYSLKGAVYGVYSKSDCSESSLVATMTTDENGESNIVSLPIREYYVKEITAPKGYALDKTTYTITVKSGETNVLKVSDKPTMDQINMLLGKVDKETNANKPVGSASLEDAEFTIKYYDGYYDTDPAASGKTAKKTWVFRTDADGYATFNEKYFVSGDSFYRSATGALAIPLGTITIQETKAPEGYLINDEVFVRQVTKNTEGVTTYNMPTIPEQSLNLNIVKTVAGKDIAIPGVKFKHTLPDGSTETVTTDSEGKASFKGLTWGDHVLEEVSAPDGYSVNPGKVTFNVAKDNKITVVSNTSTEETGTIDFNVAENGSISCKVQDNFAPYTLHLIKTNENGKALEGAEFTLYSDKKCTKVFYKGVTGADGILNIPKMKVEKTYYLKETKAPTGYRIPINKDGSDIVYSIMTKSDPNNNAFEYYVNGQKITAGSEDLSITGTKADRIVNLTIRNYTGVRLPETGTHALLIITALGVICMAGAIFAMKRRKKI